MRRFAVLVLASSLIAGCGDAPPSADSTSTTSPATTTTSSVDSTTIPATSTITTTATSSTTTPASSTTTAVPSSTFRADGTLLSLPPAEYVPSSALGTAADIDWDEVGPDWVLAAVSRLDADRYVSALVMIDPTDRVYLLGGWDREGGAWLQDWSPDGMRIAYTDGWESTTTTVIHLLQGVEGVITTDYTAHVVRFTRPTGRDVVIGRVYEGNGPVSVFRTDGSLWAELLPEGEPPDLYEFSKWPAWLYHADGMDVVVSDRESVRLLTNLGDPIRTLEIDGLHCHAVRWWTEDDVLVTCLDPVYATTEIAQMWPGTGWELWAVPIDGSTPYPVGPQAGPGGAESDPDAYDPGRVDAVALGSTVAIETDGCCECGGDLEVWRPNEEMLMPPEVECSPQLIGVRHDKALVLAGPGYVDHSFLGEVSADGAVRVVAPELWEEAWAEFVLLTDDPPGPG